jgi:nitrite reductase/ring-hydroxylating ferredoxin subunit
MMEVKMPKCPEHALSPPGGPLGRRQLLQGSLAFLGGLPLCCGTPILRSESVTFGAGQLRIDLTMAPELERTGAAAAVVDEAHGLNLIIARPDRKHFVVLDRSCTHGGAQCTYNHKRRTVQCTSLNHAEYDLDGTLLHGRTHGNLRAYMVRLSGSTLEIRLQKEG